MAMTNSRPHVEIPSPSRRRVTENDGEFTLGVIESIKITRGLSRLRGDESKSERDFTATHSRHTGVRCGEGPAEIVREEKSSRGTILRILRTAPFTLLECAGIIGLLRPARTETTAASASRKSSGSSQRRSDDERGEHHEHS